MNYSFENETYEYLLRNKLKYNDLQVLGSGAQSKVWSGIKDNNKVAIKVAFGKTETVKAENDLKSHMPDYLKSNVKVSDIFNDKSLKGIDRYYKYMIVYNTTPMDDESTFIELLNKDFENKNSQLTVDDIYNFVKGKGFDDQNSNLRAISSFIKSGSAARGEFIKNFSSKIQVGYLSGLISFFKDFENQKIYVLTGAIADKDLVAYLQDQQKLKKSSNDLNHLLLEVRKLAKHMLKGLVALHKSGRAARDIHPGNVVVTDVTKPDGKTSRIKYQLIDFGSSEALSEENSETLIKNDLYRLGYALLIPTFWALNNEELFKIPNENNYLTLSKIRGKVSMAGKLGEDFVKFLEKLRNNRFVSASAALNDVFIKSNKLS